jgi:hypothetical protein
MGLHPIPEKITAQRPDRQQEQGQNQNGKNTQNQKQNY